MGAKKKNGSGKINVEIIKEQELQQIAKSDAPTQVIPEDAYSAGNWIEPPVMLEGLKRLVTESSILPQCIRAYKNNIATAGLRKIRIFNCKNFDYPEKTLKYKHIRRISD